jgi:SOS response regulatory protein OraA/RecX
MSDKLNKLGFLAGRLFAKTVNEVKPLLNKDEPSHTDPAPILSAEEKIKKVLELLSSKKVGVNINLLLTFSRYGNLFFDSNEVRVSKEVGLSEELINEFKVKEITQQLNFYYNEKTLQILLTNNISKPNESSNYLHRYDLIILYNGFCVLRDSDRVPRSFDNNYFFESTIKSFKNGNWLDDLEYLKSHFFVNMQNKKKSEKNAKLKLIADNLDLDPLD